MKKRNNKTGKGSRKDCRAARTWLFDYACKTGELSPSRSSLVKKHLAVCGECSNTAFEMRAVADLLRSASKTPARTQTRLSLDRRRNILQSLKDKP